LFSYGGIADPGRIRRRRIIPSLKVQTVRRPLRWPLIERGQQSDGAFNLRIVRHSPGTRKIRDPPITWSAR
jgi:hypothetical protein